MGMGMLGNPDSWPSNPNTEEFNFLNIYYRIVYIKIYKVIPKVHIFHTMLIISSLFFKYVIQ